MKQFRAFVKKEFLHIWRDKRTIIILLVMPVVQIIIFGFALTNEVKNAKIVVLDESHDAATNAIIAQLDASQYFDVVSIVQQYGEIEPQFKQGNIKLAVVCLLYTSRCV